MEAAARKLNGAAMGRTSPNSLLRSVMQLSSYHYSRVPHVIPATPPRHSRVPHVIPATPPRHSRVGGNPVASLPICVLTRTTTRRIERRRRYGRKAAADVELLQRGEPSQ